MRGTHTVYTVSTQYTPAVAIPFIKIAITNPQEHFDSLVGIHNMGYVYLLKHRFCKKLHRYK